MARKTQSDKSVKSGNESLISRIFKGQRLELWVLLVTFYLLALAVLVVFGLVYLWQQGWILGFSLVVLACSLLGLIFRLVAGKVEARKQRQGQKGAEEEIPTLKARSEWSPAELQIWNQAKANIITEQWSLLPWKDIPQALFKQLSFIANCYHKNNPDAKYAFSLPELLLLCETVSRDYRTFVLQHIPLSQQTKLSTLHKLYRRRSSLGNTYKVSNYAYRLFRLSGNPLVAIINEFRNRFADTLIQGLTERMQANLKQALFEEVSQVGINLYSGRLKLSSAELAAYQKKAAAVAEFPAIKPLNVILLGQVNAGKSSLVNALKAEVVAEIDVIPATDGFNCHRCLVRDEMEIDLIDTPGIDGNAKNTKKLLERATEADLVLWLCQANQPAKRLDQELFTQWKEYFSGNFHRKPPPLLLVTTHNDQLPPSDQWQPPYDLTTDTDSKTLNMLDCLHYTQEVMGLAQSCASVPIALPPEGTAYNIDTLSNLLTDLAGDARSSQRNRDRLQATGSRPSLKKTWQQSLSLGKVVGKLAVQGRQPKPVDKSQETVD